MKKVTKSFVALLALVAMLTQNAFGVYAQATAPEPIQVENEYVSENAEPTVEVTTEEAPADTQESSEGDMAEPVADTSSEPVDAPLDVDNLPPTDDVNYDDQIMLIDDTAEAVDEGADIATEEPITEEVIEEEIPEQLDIYDNQISGSGLNELEVFINTEMLETGDSFRILFSGPDSAQYDTRLNDFLDTTSHGLYRFLDLNNEGFNIRATSDDNVTFEFASEDGRPVIKVISVESDDDKLLFTKTVEDKNGKAVTAIKGEGLKDVTIKVNSEKLTDDATYTVYVDTEAEVTMNGSTTDSISGTKSLESIELSNLNKKQFIIYVSADEGFEINSDASVIDVVSGEAEFILESVATKTVYEYEDSNVYVRAVLERADAIPDDAYFSVEPITDTKEYLDAMNEDGEKYTDENTLLYDIAFYTDSTKTEEIEPEAGSVSVTIRFKKNQINEELTGEAEVEDVTVTHFEENGNTIEAVPVETNVSSDNTKIDFTVDSFSVYAVSATSAVTVNPGTSVSCDSVLGDAYYYGIVGNYVNLAGHLESNMAAGTLDGNANIATPKNDGGGAGVSYIGSYLGSKFFMDPNSGTKGSIKIYTTEEAVNKFGNEMRDRINTGKVTIDYSKPESEIKSIVSNMVNVVASNSAKLAKEATQIDFTELKQIRGTDGYIDISGSEAGTYYINYDISEWANEGSSFKYKINSNQNLVLNIPDKSVEFCQYQLIVDNKQYTPQGGSNEEILFEKVIYNCPNATYAATSTPVTGTFLLPKAGFYNNSVAAGFVVADRIEKIGGAEWHCISKNIPVIEDDKTELEIPVTKYFKDAAGNDIANSEWPASGFKFKISKYACTDPGDANDPYVERDINNIPDIKGPSEVTIYGSTPNHTASFGKLTFNGAEVYNSPRSHVSGAFKGRDVRYRALMYKIEEIDTNEAGILYDNATPLYIKVFVNAEKITNNGTVKYLVWTEVKTARTVLTYECEPKLPEFTNRRVNDTKVKFEGTKTVNGSSENVPNEKFEFSLYKYKGSNQFEESPIQTVKNNNNSFAFDEFKVNYDECTTYVDANDKAIQDVDKAEKISRSEYGYQYYLIKETKCESPYTANDKYIARVKIEKIKNNGVLSGYAASVEYFKYNANDTTDITKLGDGLKVMSFDNTYAAKGSIILYAKKVVSNRTYGVKNQEFSFSLYDGNGTKLQGPVKNDENGNIKFNEINYSLNDVGKTFTYVIKEDEGNVSGITYDTHSETITVKVTDNGDGTLNVSADKATENSPVTFTNVYKAEGTFTITALKAFKEGSKLPANKTFSFVLKENGNVIETVTVKGTGSVSFNALKYALKPDTAKGEYAIGEHTYTIEEVMPEGANADNNYTYQGIRYDNTIYTVKVVVEDDNNGKLVTKVDGVEQATFIATFTNDYSVENTKITLNGNKVLKGKVLESDMFTFKLEASDEATSKAVSEGIVVLSTDTVNNDANGNFSFGDITFKSEGDYTFKVTEVKPDETNGIQYSEDVYTVKVSVKDDNNGKLVATKTITKNNGEVGDITFINYYAENGIVITAKKSLDGRTLEANQFEFVLKDEAGNVVGTAKNDAAGNVTFNKITYKLSDLSGADSKTYTYYVSEVCPDKDGNGYQYDRTVKTVTVTVSKIVSEDGVSLQAVAEFENADDTFKNYYNATGEVVFGGTKELIGRKFTSDDNGKFQAVLKEVKEDGTFIKELQRKDITKKAALFSDRGGEFTFDAISYTEPGNYYYTVEEEGSAENVTNDTTVYKVKVTVTDNGDGTLSCAPTYSVGEGIKFTNIYDTPGSAIVQAYKSINYGTLKDKQFTFELYDSTGNAIDTATNNSSGTVTFKSLNYTLKDLNKDTSGNAVTTTFTYKIKEKNTGLNGFTYSTVEYDVIVTVTPNDDTLTTSVEYKDAAGNVVDAKNVIFNNEYTANGEVQLQAKKILSGRAITKGMFEFELRDENNDVVAKVPVPEAKAGEEAIVSFPKWTFTQENLKEDNLTHAIEGGKFAKYYTIREVIPANIPSGYTYDDTIYNVVVTLEDNGEGSIITDWYAYESGSTYEKPTIWQNIVAIFTGKNADKNVVFENKYVAEGELKLKAVKKTNGVLNKDDFAFILEGKDENGKDISETVRNDANGNIVFSEIKFTKASDTPYVYTIKEVIPKDSDKKPGFTYDETIYTVSVTVEDNGSGVLSVNAVISAPLKNTVTAVSSVVTNEDGSLTGLCVPEAVAFTNTYTTGDASVVIEGNKVIAGRKAQAADGEFTFKLSGGNLAEDRFATTKAGGSFAFDTIKYTYNDLNGKDLETYTYTVSEVIPSEKDANITYSEEVYTVEVTLKDNHDGTLTASRKIVGANSIVFTNTYNAENSLPLAVKKVVTGKKSPDGLAFTFELSGTGIEPAIQVNAKAGETVSFPTRQYKLADLYDEATKTYVTREYDYVIREIPNTAEEYAGYEYDATQFKIHVEVSNDSTDGNLTVKPTVVAVDEEGNEVAGSFADVLPAAFEFNNPYTANGQTEITGTKTLIGRELVASEFEFALYDENSVEIARCKNAEDGSFSFGNLSFTQEDVGKTFNYTVKEIIPENKEDRLPNVNYDDTVISVAIEVLDAGEGKLAFNQTVTNGREGKVAFVNEFADDASVSFAVEKKLTGRNLNEGEFEFVLKQTAGDTIKSFESKEKTVSNNGSGIVDFGSIKFDQTEVGEYKFEITEKSGDVKGVDYSKNKYTATVNVYVKNGELVVEKIEETGDTTFTNEFKASAHVDFGGSKILDGFESDKINKGEYTFILKDSEGNKIAETSVNGRGNYEFSHKDVAELNYTQDDLVYNAATGKYTTVKTYTVEEFEPESHDKKITYDKKVYTVTVKLDLNTVTGELTVETSTDKGVAVTEMNFTNKYADEDEWSPSVTKVVEGKNYENGKYTYKLTQVDEDGKEIAGGYTETIKNSDVTTSFAKIKFNQSQLGTYFYKIEELATEDGTAVDSTIYIAKVVVDIDEATQELAITDTYTKVAGDETVGVTEVVFTNKYSASVEIPLEGLKKLENRELKDKEFSFAIMDGDKVLVNDGTEMIAYNVAGTVDEDGVAQGKFVFPVMKFNQEVFKNESGTYDNTKTLTYTVVEQSKSKDDCKGITMSTERYSLVIELTSGIDGITYEVKIDKLGESGGFLGLKDGKAALEFTNVYDAEGKWDPEGWKELVGRDLKDGEFSFKIEEVDQNDRLVKDHEYTVTNVGNHIKFSSDDVISKKGDKFLHYSITDLDPETGVRNYIYKISEVKQESADGVTYDSDVYTINVRVEDNKDGTLKVLVNKQYILPDVAQKIKDANLEAKISEDAIFLFTNEYEAKGAIELIGTKTFDGPEEFAKDFMFAIKETTEGSADTEFTVKNEGGVVTFGSNLSMLSYEYKPSMKIDDRGLHTYEIREVIPADENKAPGVKYDERVYKVTVEVSDDGEGNLVPTVKSLTSELNGGGQEPYDFFAGSDENRANYFRFENKYEANADLLFKGRKFLKRYEDSKDYITGDELTNFKFALYRVDATKDTLIDSVAALADGSFVLGLNDNGDVADGLKFTQNDIGKTYTYKLYEEKKVGDGVVYDENVYEITVAVNAPAAGSDKLKLDVTAIDKSGATVAVKLENDEYLYTASTFDFTNLKPEYTVISGEKHWVGGPADGSRPDEVTIKLYASNVGVGQQVINTAVAKAPDWKYRFDSFENGKKLPAYTTDGQKIVYRVDEVEIPGYLSEKVEVVEGKVYDFYNTYGELLIRKVDAITGATLAGAELVILDSAGTEVDRWVSGTSAHAVDITKVEFDKTYTLREVSAPTGYKVAPDQTFTFKKGETTVVTMRDEKITGSVKLRKLDATTRAALEGAEFALYREDGSRVYASGTAGSYRYSETSSNGRFVVNAAGELEVTDLPYGSYYFTETVAPAGYIRSTDRFSFSVLTDGETVEVVALNAKEVGSVRLRKTNADGSVSLAGAVFELYAKTPTTVSSAIASTIYSDVYYRVGTYTTDASGEIYVGDLPWDDYYFVEVEAPTGYEVNTDVNGDPIAYTFTIGSTATATVSYDLGRITNSTTPPDTPVVPRSGGEVRGERRPTDTGRRSGGVLSGVLGVRAAPKAGVLGERLGPVTGDAFNIFLWTLLLLASIGSIIAVAIANAKRKKRAR